MTVVRPTLYVVNKSYPLFVVPKTILQRIQSNYTEVRHSFIWKNLALLFPSSKAALKVLRQAKTSVYIRSLIL